MIRDLYADVSEAVEEGLLSDATSRNALYKIHVSLGKIVNTLDEQQPSNRRTSRSASVAATDRQAAEDRTVLEEPKIKEEELNDSDEGTVVLKKDDKESATDDVSSDEEDTKMETA